MSVVGKSFFTLFLRSVFVFLLMPNIILILFLYSYSRIRSFTRHYSRSPISGSPGGSEMNLYNDETFMRVDSRISLKELYSPAIVPTNQAWSSLGANPALYDEQPLSSSMSRSVECQNVIHQPPLSSMRTVRGSAWFVPVKWHFELCVY